MNQIPFSKSLMASIQAQLKAFQNTQPGPYFAAFDADGTLWDTDVGEQFFQYQIDHCGLKALNDLNPWDQYRSLKKEDPKKAYLWLAQINQGHTIQRVRLWAQEAVDAKPIAFLESQKELIQWMQNNDITPIVVTASIKWAVEPAAKTLEIPFDDVCGVQTAFSENGRVGEKQKGPITWREGKVKALLERTAGVAPIFCAGNTSGDTALVSASQCVRLAVQTQSADNSLFQDEQNLKNHALEQGWLTHHFFTASR